MAGNGIKKEDNRQKLRNELDNLMQGFEETFAEKSGGQDTSNIIGRRLDEIARPAKTYDFDLEALDAQFKAKASLLLNSMLDFYVDAGVIDRVEYSKNKLDLDKSNLANMLWQLKTVKITITVLMDEILSGNTEPKTIAALGDMQGRFSEIMRMQANYVMFLEDTYKKMKYDTADICDVAEDKKKNELASARKEAEDNEYFLTANPKELIRQITEVSPLTEEEHAGMLSSGEDCVRSGIGTKNTDPKLKEELMAERGVDFEKKPTDSEGYDSILNMI